MYNENRRSPEVEPQRMPHLMGTGENEQFHTLSEKLLSLKRVKALHRWALKISFIHLVSYEGVTFSCVENHTEF